MGRTDDMVDSRTVGQTDAHVGDKQGTGPDYCALVGKALFADCYTLDAFPVLSQLPLVSQWAEAHPHDLLPRGKALYGLLRRAVADVVTCAPEGDRFLGQVAEFARLRYQERLTVAAIAQRWGLSCKHLHCNYRRPALELVTRRFLQLSDAGRWIGQRAVPAPVRATS
jgi:hypothetical protein